VHFKFAGFVALPCALVPLTTRSERQALEKLWQCEVGITISALMTVWALFS